MIPPLYGGGIFFPLFLSSSKREERNKGEKNRPAGDFDFPPLDTPFKNDHTGGRDPLCGEPPVRSVTAAAAETLCRSWAESFCPIIEPKRGDVKEQDVSSTDCVKRLSGFGDCAIRFWEPARRIFCPCGAVSDRVSRPADITVGRKSFCRPQKRVQGGMTSSLPGRFSPLCFFLLFWRTQKRRKKIPRAY